MKRGNPPFFITPQDILETKKMPYAPKTMLSYADERGTATVLTEDKVMVTSGLGTGQMMKLADWIILAHGARIVELYIPLDDSMPELEPVAQPEPVVPAMVSPVPELKPLAIGCKLRWTLNQETYRVAIQTDKGVLQVKSVTDGAGECHEDGCTCTPCAELRMVPPAPWRTRRPLKKMLFANEITWKASLPEGGTIEITGPAPKIAPSNPQVAAAMSDYEKVRQLQNVYKMKVDVYLGQSPYDMMEALKDAVKTWQRGLANLSLDDMLANQKAVRMRSNQLKYTIECYSKVLERVQTLGEEASKVKPVRVRARSKHMLYANINQMKYVVSTFEGKITLSNPSRHSEDAMLFDNFAQMSSTKPKFYRIYRNVVIPLPW